MDNTIIIVGDLCPKDRIAQLFKEKQYAEVFHNMKPVIEQATYAIANLEAPIVEGKGTPIAKSGPNLKCTDTVIDAILYAGFKGVTLANNHFYDYGEDGALTTMQKLSENKIDYVGAGKDIEDAAKTLYVTVGTKTVAIINCCEHEYSIATREHAGSNPLNPVALCYDINEAKGNSDFVLVIVHGGIEHYQLPTPRMKEIYRFAIDCGADAVVNHHQHCYSGYEVYKGHPIFYGLGNFCFDWKGRKHSKWNEGYMVKLSIEENGFELIPYTQCDDYPTVQLMKSSQRELFDNKIIELNDIIEDNEKLESTFCQFVKESMREFDPIHPYSNRWLKALYKRHWLPSFLSQKKLMSIQNKLNCESHLERLILSINMRIKTYGKNN